MNGAYFLAVFERAAKTFAQTALALWGVNATPAEMELTWQATLAAAGLAAGLSVISSIASSGFGGSAGPSVGPEKLST